MNPTNPQLCSPEDLSLMFDIYGEELKNSNFFSTPSQSKSPQEQVFCFEEPEEEKKMIEDKENLYQPTVITPYKLRNQLLRSPLYDITPCPKTKKKDSCNVTPKTLDYFSTPKMSSLKKKKQLKEIREMR